MLELFNLPHVNCYTTVVFLFSPGAGFAWMKNTDNSYTIHFDYSTSNGPDAQVQFKCTVKDHLLFR